MLLLVFLSLEEITATRPFPNYLKKGRPNLILAPRGNTYFRSLVLGHIFGFKLHRCRERETNASYGSLRYVTCLGVL